VWRRRPLPVQIRELPARLRRDPLRGPANHLNVSDSSHRGNLRATERLLFICLIVCPRRPRRSSNWRRDANIPDFTRSLNAEPCALRIGRPCFQTPSSIGMANLGPTAYVEIPLGLRKPDTCPLRRIVIGPRTHRGQDIDDIVNSVEMPLQKYGIQVRSPATPNGVEIATSQIPYRSA